MLQFQFVSTLVAHTVKTAWEQGWDRLINGDLVQAAETAGFDVMLTSDQSIPHQQNLKDHRIAIVVLGKGQWPYIKPVVERVVIAVNAAQPGTITLVEIPVP